MVAIGEYGETWWSMRPGKYFLKVLVHPDYRRRGIGTALYEYLWELLGEHNPVLLTGTTREDQADGMRLLAKYGFEQVMRFQISHLDVTSFDPQPFAPTLKKVGELGIQILPLAEVATTDEDWERKLWDLEWELAQDVPASEPLTRLSFEIWQERAIKSPGFNAEGQMIAMDERRWVGMSALWMAQGDPRKLYTGLTGVVRSHRRKGIAMAMKVQALEFAKRYGAVVIETENEENNPMYLLNLKLGFKPKPAWLEFHKRIAQE
jgi:GNAT superfamily N-acetyltransferase